MSAHWLIQEHVLTSLGHRRPAHQIHLPIWLLRKLPGSFQGDGLFSGQSVQGLGLTQPIMLSGRQIDNPLFTDYLYRSNTRF